MRSRTSSAAGERGRGRAATAAALVIALAGALGCDGAGRPAPSGLVAGRVVDATFRPLPGVTVRWAEHEAATDREGRYELAVAPGLRRLELFGHGVPATEKVVLVATGTEPTRLDALFGGSGPDLLLERPPAGPDRDPSGAISFELTDAFGNHRRFLPLGPTAHDATWEIPGRTLLVGLDAPISGDRSSFGVYRLDLETDALEAVATGRGVTYLARRADGLVAAADQKEAFLVRDGAFEPLWGDPGAEGWILSMDWGPDGRLYVTFDDQLPTEDPRRTTSRSRIVALGESGTEATWAAADDRSYRYPVHSDEWILYARFSLDGNEKALLAARPGDVDGRVLGPFGLRPVARSPDRDRLWYLEGSQLRLRAGTSPPLVLGVGIRGAKAAPSPAGEDARE